MGVRPEHEELARRRPRPRAPRGRTAGPFRAGVRATGVLPVRDQVLEGPRVVRTSPRALRRARGGRHASQPPFPSPRHRTRWFASPAHHNRAHAATAHRVARHRGDGGLDLRGLDPRCRRPWRLVARDRVLPLRPRRAPCSCHSPWGGTAERSPPCPVVVAGCSSAPGRRSACTSSRGSRRCPTRASRRAPCSCSRCRSGWRSPGRSSGNGPRAAAGSGSGGDRGRGGDRDREQHRRGLEPRARRSACGGGCDLRGRVRRDRAACARRDVAGAVLGVGLWRRSGTPRGWRCSRSARPSSGTPPRCGRCSSR